MIQSARESAISLRHAGKLYIRGDWVAPSSRDVISVIDSATELTFLEVAAAQTADVNSAVGAARQAFDSGPWPRLSHIERAVFMRGIGELLLARSDQISDFWSREMGILRVLGPMFVNASADINSYYADLANTFEFEEWKTASSGFDTGVVREPVGVVAAIIPWNGPLPSIIYKLAPALLAGCTVVIKMSPEAPSAGYILAEICEELGLPAGVVNIITAEREVSEFLVRHPGVDKVTFTGSVAAGRRIGAICGERMARLTLELGGKSPAIFLADCNLQSAATTIAQTTSVMSGQVCASLSRLIVPRPIYKDFVEALVGAFTAIRVGDPFVATSQMGPLASNNHRERVEGYIAKGENEGAQLIAGGRRPKSLDRGYFVDPTVFADVANDMVIAREEIFGPVVTVIPVRDEQQAIGVANDSMFGLNAAIFTADREKAHAVARQLKCGTVSHNALKVDFRMGFGGYKQSGIGREGGIEGLRPFLESKTIILHTKEDL